MSSKLPTNFTHACVRVAASASSTPIRALLLVVAGVLVTASVAVFLFLQAPGSLDNPPVAAPRPSPRVPPPVREVPKGPDPSALLYEPEGHDHFAADALDASGLLPLTTGKNRVCVAVVMLLSLNSVCPGLTLVQSSNSSCTATSTP